MSAHLPIALLLSIFVLFVTVLAGSATAQTSPATVNLNSYICPEGFDRIDDCAKVGGVVVRVEADGIFVGETMTDAAAGVDVGVPVGSQVTLSIVGGQPADAVLEEEELTFTIVEGVNSTSIVFLREATTDPGTVDSDGDGLTDAQEVELGTDASNLDTDEDGVQDGGEVHAGTDPLSPDTDGDGFTDKEELDVQTDPLAPASYPTESLSNSITVTAYTCPAGFDGKDLFDACVEPAVGIDFTVYIPGSEFGVTQTTDSSGSVSFSDLGSGQFVVRADLADLDVELQRYTAFCFGEPYVEGAPEPRQIVFSDLGDGQYGLEMTQGEVIHCTWYNIPVGGDVAQLTPTPVPVKVLPETGTGAPSGDDAQPTMTLLIGSAALMMVTMSMLVRRRTV